MASALVFLIGAVLLAAVLADILQTTISFSGRGFNHAGDRDLFVDADPEIVFHVEVETAWRISTWTKMS